MPLAGQIIAVADTYEAMTSSRTYRQALTHDAAIAELRRGSGTQLNPTVVNAFVRQIESAPRDAAQAHDDIEHVHVRERAVEAVRRPTQPEPRWSRKSPAPRLTSPPR